MYKGPQRRKILGSSRQRTAATVAGTQRSRDRTEGKEVTEAGRSQMTQGLVSCDKEFGT